MPASTAPFGLGSLVVVPRRWWPRSPRSRGLQSSHPQPIALLLAEGTSQGLWQLDGDPAREYCCDDGKSSAVAECVTS
jgi:hypothetical protein